MTAYYTRKEYADNRFMDKGVELQIDAQNWWEAKRSYQYSCMLCCMHNCSPIKCTQCPIREAMLINAVVFQKRMPKQEKEWVKKEKELL